MREGSLRLVTLARWPLAVALASLLLCHSVSAEEKWSGSLAATSNYVQQGLSLTRGEPALQGGLRAEVSPGLVVGVWGSRVESSGAGGTYELDLYVARRWVLAPDWSTTWSATHYAWPDTPAPMRYDYDEVAAALTWRSRLTATIAWSPNLSAYASGYLARDRSAWSYELTSSMPLWNAFELSVGAGWRDLRNLFDEGYFYGHAGVQYSTRAMSVHLTHMITDDAAAELFGRARLGRGWTVTALWSFGGAR